MNILRNIDKEKEKELYKELIKTIRNVYIPNEDDRPLDCDDVFNICNKLKIELNYHEGNISLRKYKLFFAKT